MGRHYPAGGLAGRLCREFSHTDRLEAEGASDGGECQNGAGKEQPAAEFADRSKPGVGAMLVPPDATTRNVMVMRGLLGFCTFQREPTAVGVLPELLGD